MGKCTCSLMVGIGNLAPTVLSEEVEWPISCSECEEQITSAKTAGFMGRPNGVIKVVCSTCMEIGKCFFCDCTFGSLWDVLRLNYHKIGLGKLTELLSPEAKAVLIEKVDQWFLEDNEDE